MKSYKSEEMSLLAGIALNPSDDWLETVEQKIHDRSIRLAALYLINGTKPTKKAKVLADGVQAWAKKQKGT